MYADLKDYNPENVEFVLPEHVKDIFPSELDFSKVEGADVNNVMDAMRFVGDKLVATFPSCELAERKLDAFEIHNIREEYCVMQENEVPRRKQFLIETLEEIKAMKKAAEEAYSSILAEVAKYAAEVRAGKKEVQLSAKETFCIALSGYYAIYTYDRSKNCFVLAKAYEVDDHSELWANEEKNREAMRELFGLELPEAPKPEAKEEVEEEDDNLPFGDLD